METGSRKWGRPYLTREFYLADRRDAWPTTSCWSWPSATAAGSPARSTSSARDTLFGRHWGAVEHHPFLHFEVCYYQAIDFAIARGLKTVEAGAQGEHKLARGYLPLTTYSAHYIADPGLRRAIADYLKRERAYVAEAGARTHRGRAVPQGRRRAA